MNHLEDVKIKKTWCLICLLSLLLCTSLMLYSCTSNDGDTTTTHADQNSQDNNTATTDPVITEAKDTNESPKTTFETVFELTQDFANTCGGTNVIHMAAEMIGADSGASFKIGENQYGIYLYSNTDLLEEAKSGTLTMTVDWLPEPVTINTVVNGNLVLTYDIANDTVTEQFKSLIVE